MSVYAGAFGLENDDVVPPMEDGAVAEVVDTMQENDEVSQLDADMQELKVAIDTTANAADALEQVAEFIEEKQETEGGLTEGEAAVTAIATEALLKPFKGLLKVKIPSNESFGAKGSRVQASAFALESIKENVQKMWEGIKKFCRTWMDKAMEWFRANYSSAARLQKAAKATALKAGDAKGTPGEKTLKMGAAEFKYLSLDGSAVAGADALKNLTGIFKSDATLADIRKENKAVIEALNGLSAGLDDATYKTFVGHLPTVAESTANYSKADEAFAKQHGGNETTQVFVSKTVYLGKVVDMLKVKTEKSEDKERAVGFVMSVQDADPSFKFKDDNQPTALSSGEIESVASSVADLAGALIGVKRHADEAAATAKRAEAILEKLAKELDKLDGKSDEGKGKIYHSVKNLVRGSAVIITGIASGERANFDYGMKVGRAWLGYANKSLNNLKTESKATA